jgi:hypothetical protein
MLFLPREIYTRLHLILVVASVLSCFASFAGTEIFHLAMVFVNYIFTIQNSGTKT